MISALFADRFTWRMPFIVGPQLVVIRAYGILIGKASEITENIPFCYFGNLLSNGRVGRGASTRSAGG